MIDHEHLQTLTENYLSALIAEVSASPGGFDAHTPFGELGVNSFHVLKILKLLEQDFGKLPKTLMFENFHIHDLAAYFVRKHEAVLQAKFSNGVPVAKAATAMDATAMAATAMADVTDVTEAAAIIRPAIDIDAALTLPSDAVAPSLAAQSVSPAAEEARATECVPGIPALVAVGNLDRYPQLKQCREALFHAYKNESSVSRGTQLIAPWLFFGPQQRGYFNCGRYKDILLAYGYTGSEDYFLPLVEALYRYCEVNHLQFNMFAERPLPAVGGVSFTATPFGVMQRVVNLADFSTEGQKMRRLRYQVAKFEKSGQCRTEEYLCGSDAEKAQQIAAIIDTWCASRSMVNPLIYIVRDEILAGTLDREHRLFLTYLDDVMQNVILISPMSGGGQKGYLMDLEFYGKDMPLGGLEYAIVNIVQALVAEGCDVFSMGGTYGCKLQDSPCPDTEVEAILDDLRKQNIFNDEGNLQFKNKFRPVNSDILLCRPMGAGNADNVIDIIMMIADPARAQEEGEKIAQTDASPFGVAPTEKAPEAALATGGDAAPAHHDHVGAPVRAVDAASALPGNARVQVLAEEGFNPMNLAAQHIDVDVKTDSWAQLKLPAIERHMAQLFGQLQQPVAVNEVLQGVFPFRYFTLTPSGRDAENIFCQAWEKRGRVPQNLLFPTTIFHQIDKGFTPVELPCDAAFVLQSKDAFKGQLHWEKLQREVAAHAGDIAYVCIELSNNASGGGAVSLHHLREVKALLQANRIPLVLDITRIVENALGIIASEPGYQQHSLWQVVTEICQLADALLASLAKNFCVNKGGMIATHDAALHERLQRVLQSEGKALDVIDKKCIALALHQPAHIERQCKRRAASVQTLAQRLAEQQIPVILPAAAHCVLIDVKRLPLFQQCPLPVPAFVAWLYLNSGIRAGAHSVGMQQDTALNGLVRLAIPVGLKAEEVADLGDRLLRAFAELRNIPVLLLAEDGKDSVGDVHARYRLQQYLRAEAPAAPPAPVENPRLPVQATESSSSTLAAASKNVPAPVRDIAIVGMAGRFPKARSIEALWENLRQGRDCIDVFPESRYLRRRQRETLGRYRGGFIDDLDRFDSLFFNISPREAETLDPQERIFLEVAWEALEDAGYYPELLASEECGNRNIGVYVGAVWAMYQMVGAEERLVGTPAVANSFLWSVANRVSYFMNFTGPSMAVDTACSASLTALHLACDAIRRGECAAAIVGGVNLDAHQCKQEITVAGGLLSDEGYCRAFGRDAGGYVPGEGVGAILLKPLAQAQRDRDNIYAVVKSSAVNHGGRNSGYSVPNPKAQSEVILAALEKADIDARSVGYIEAHGTGTELGDPIEITGLNQAFERFGVARQSCAIGSIKTNIGHLEAAAGIAGVCKVLLQMRHRQLLPSLHSAELNEFIDFAESPFVVQQQCEPWQGKIIDGVTQPLRAGISSFGAGGANAHVILEAVDEVRASVQADAARSHIVPLSARSEEQLREMAQRLAAHLEKYPELPLGDIAFTLQCGRKSFDHRVAFVVASVAALSEKLQGFAAGKRDEQTLCGHVKNAEALTRMLSKKEKAAFIRLLAESREPAKIAQLWIDGLLADWQGLHTQSDGQRISLPTYPFADKRHWLGEALPANAALFAPGAIQRMHPMIDSNVSTFERQVFRKLFTDQEFFIYDHLVSEIPTLPGVAYLDFARKAGELAAGRKVQKIKNIVWVSPLTVENAVPNEVFIELKPAGDSVGFEVFSEREDGAKQLYSQGKLVYASAQDLAAEAEYIDLPAIQQRCQKVIDGERAYPLFKTLGLDLGPSFQCLQEVFRNPGAGFEVLGALRLPAIADSRLEDFILHPSLVDASFQAAMGARLADTAGEMFVPYSLGEVEILHPLTPVCFSYVTEARDEKKSPSNLSKMNVLIVDEQGKVLVKVRESVGVPLLDVHEKPAHGDAPKIASKEKATADEDVFSTLYYRTAWQTAEALPAPAQQAATLVLFAPEREWSDGYRALLASCYPQQKTIVVLMGDSYQRLDAQHYRVDPDNAEHFVQLLAELRGADSNPLHLCYAWAAQPTWDKADARAVIAVSAGLDRGVLAFLYLCQALIAQKLEAEVRLHYLYASEADLPQAHNEAIQGFITILRAESPRLVCKVIELEQADAALDDATVAALQGEFYEANDAQQTKPLAVRYRAGQRSLRRIEAWHAPVETQQVGAPETDVSQIVGIKEGGVYLITGGAGGLGLIFADYLAKHYRARLVLSGRSALKRETENLIDGLRDAGAQVHYVQADIATAEGVQQLVDTCQKEFGGLNGIIHSAGVLRDAYVRNKNRQDMQAVFAPKIQGAVYLDEATKDLPLDFFVMFSSLAALAGNAGQSDYAFANHFMDAFARRRNGLQARGLRYGKSLSLNWSIWEEGGMQLDEQTALFFKRNLGIQPLARAVGIEAMLEGLRSPLDHLAVVQGVRDKIERAWGIGVEAEKTSAPAPAKAASTASVAVASADGSDLSLAVQNTLSGIVMAFLKLDADDIDLDKILLDLGFDSIGLTSFANLVNEKYGLDVTPVLFFEYPNIREIAKYIAEEYADKVAAVHGTVKKTAVSAASVSDGDAIVLKKAWRPSDASADAAPVQGGGFSPARRFVEQPIAIVGMAGVMPQSDDLEEYWQNLARAENVMVTEIPRDRWRWEDYYGNPLEEENKTLSKWGGFMREVDKFDPLFWGISPREAIMMDPQQRIFLETVWQAVEDSGHKVSELSGTKTGLFVGAATRDYIDLMAAGNVELDGYSASGTSHAVLANRISFLLNLQGPSAPLDTACSSSLVALHRAIESIHTGSSDMAIVGGVQVMLTPAAFISFGAAGMLADDGKCKTFDERANGYVRGEGSGAIFIKPLAMAEADGDHIYAVIKSTAENHGGKATMLTAPNPNAQAELLVEAYEKAEVDPTTVGYIECHGTGTSLGDPIEVQAMKKAFSELYKKHNKPAPAQPHIGLTSAKTNIGHLETAAGIAGILKVLLSMKHKKIPALLHFEKLNPYINIANTPFYMVDKTQDWPALQDEQGNILPRRAGVSSFGFGGANVHVVLEEYLSKATAAALPGPQLILISAKNRDRLKDYARKLLAHVNTHDDALSDIAYTLQVGRDVMEERLAFCVATREAFAEVLQAYIDGTPPATNLHQGRVAKNKGASLDIDEHKLATWLGAKDLDKLGEAWTKGVDIDWVCLYDNGCPRRISLPTYPFARERYWVETRESAADHHGKVQHLHPLLQRNISDLRQQCYATQFSGREYFVAEREMNAHAQLSPMVFLEMARAAVADALRLTLDSTDICLADVQWSAQGPGDLSAPLQVSVSEMSPDEIAFEIFSSKDDTEYLWCQGIAILNKSETPLRRDMAQLRQHLVNRNLSADELYGDLTQRGLHYGDSMRCIDALHFGHDQRLAQLKLPETVNADVNICILHPILLEAITQVLLTLDATAKLYVDEVFGPLAMRSLSVFKPLSAARYLWLRYARGGHLGDGQLRLDADFMDADGSVCATLKSLTFSAPEDSMVRTDFESLLDLVQSASDDDSLDKRELFTSILDRIY